MTDPGPDDSGFDGGADGIDVVESGTERVESSEYGFAMEATAIVEGPAGRLLVRRRYEALPYHNDDLYPEGADSNDGRTDRPNEIHVHTRFYTSSGDDSGHDSDYFGDAHESWMPERAAVLGNPDELANLCRAHHLADPVALYRNAMDRR